MPRALRIAYVTHSVRSDWNNGNAHFLRGLLRAMAALGHAVTILEPATGWSIDNLRDEPQGDHSLAQFASVYSDLAVRTFASFLDVDEWRTLLSGCEVVVLHEWNPAGLAQMLLRLQPELGYKLLFHDTHHRASSSPDEIAAFGIDRFDGVIAFGEVLRSIYRDRFHMPRVWTLHEAADTTIFRPQAPGETQQDVVWIGNWGDEERSSEIRQFYLQPAATMPDTRFTIYGVRYPDKGLQALRIAGVRYGGYLPNLEAPTVYADSRVTVHLPRRHYATTMIGIPTIRVFEALACGIPLISAPWQDAEALFREGDLRFVTNSGEMVATLRDLLANPARAAEQAARGKETVLARHTCNHRAQELTAICEEVLD